MSIARHHSEWLSLVEVSGPFLSMPVLMRAFPQGLENHDPEKFRTLRLAYAEWQDNNEKGSRTNPAVHGAWVKFVLMGVLGMPDEAILEQQSIPQTLQASVAEHGEFLRPSLVIAEPGTAMPRLVVQTYPASQDLDKPVNGKSWKASPGTRMMELCHATGVRLGLITNGERWMLVDAPKNETTGFASWYANIWLEEAITLRAFTSLLGAERFFSVAPADTLEALLKESAGNQQEVTDQLGYQVRRAVEVLIQSLDRADQDHDRCLLVSTPEPQIYEAALTIMMRLVFLFCSEERRLLPIDSELYATHYAASTMREQLRKTADDHGEEILERRHDAWCRLLACFRLVFGGCEHANLRMPAYGGHLFDPDRFPFLEGRKPTTSWRTCEADPLPVNNRTVLHLLEALQMLEVKMPGGEKAARRLSFRALDIEQIGHVYEGLLDHTAKRATEPMLGLAGGRDKEPEVALSKLEELKATSDNKLVEFLADQTGRSPRALEKALAKEIDLPNATRMEAECGSDKQLFERVRPFAALVREDTRDYPVIIRKGSVFVTAGTDRRSSGTHYTPRSLTEPIVQYTLEPLVYVGPAEGKPKEQWQLRTPKELLELKICDMACGSGAFLVQACRYLSERLVEAWEQAEKTHPGTPGITPEGEASKGATGETLIPKDADERMAYAKRLVAQRCLYGVDINPLAAEMAKLSLWLLTLAKDKPFTFLDHTIRCGDSLLGVTRLCELKAFSLDGSRQQYVFGEEPLDELVNRALALRMQIETIPAATVEDVSSQEALLRASDELLVRLNSAADFLISAELVDDNGSNRVERQDHAAVQVGYHLARSTSGDFKKAAERELGGRRAFHWPLQFPEVFAQRGGFSGFVGNPPFMGGKKISGALTVPYLRYLKAAFSATGATTDLCAYFFRRAFDFLAGGGCFCLVATNTIAEGDTRQVALAPLAKAGTIYHAIRSKPWPGDASLEVSVVAVARSSWSGLRELDGKPVEIITAMLADDEALAGRPLSLASNCGHCFMGTIILGEGFILTEEDARSLLQVDRRNSAVLSRYMNGDDLANRVEPSPSRWVINFGDMAESDAARFAEPFRIVQERVKPQRDAVKRAAYRERWWQFAEKCTALYQRTADFERVLICGNVSKYLNFVFVPNNAVFTANVFVFDYQDWGVFACLQSTLHEVFARTFSATLETRLSYSPRDALEPFAFPLQLKSLRSVGEAYHGHRHAVMVAGQRGLTKTYNRFHDPEERDTSVLKLRDLHTHMDKEVIAAYGWGDLDLGQNFHETKQGTRFTISEKARREVVTRLLKLNHERYAEEVAQGLHDKKKSAKPRATKPAVVAPQVADVGLFVSLAYPATDADRAICAAALAVVEASDGLSSMEHLDALLLATQTDRCTAFLNDTDAKAVKQAVKAAPKALFLSDTTPINWKQCRDHLELRGAIHINRGNAEQSLKIAADSKAVAAVKASLPLGTENIVRLALKAVERLTALKQDLTAASEDQRRYVLAIQLEEKALLQVA